MSKASATAPPAGRFLLMLLTMLAQQGDAPAQEAGQSKSSTMTEQYQAILAEWRAAAQARQQVLSTARADGKTTAEAVALANAQGPGQQTFVQRFLDLAARDPQDPGARDALIWVATRGPRQLEGSIKTATDLLARYHANDPRAARVALSFAGRANAENEALIRAFDAGASAHEAKGTATLALAQFLARKADAASFAAGKSVQPTAVFQRIDPTGRPRLEETNQRPFDDAYWAHLKAADAQALLLESEALYDRLIAEFADVPYEPAAARVNPNAAPPPKTLGEVAEAHYSLSVGQSAPAIEGTDLDGQPLTLAEHRGKVVLLVFWGSWCGPCLEAFPWERAMVTRFNERPFVLLGVNCEPNADDARRAVRDHGVNWRSWLDGPAGQGKIANRFLVRGFPSVYLIDAQGVIRRKTMGVVGLDQAVAALVTAAEASSVQTRTPARPEAAPTP